jgi:hypothetical protein
MRQSLGTAVFSGMIGVTLFGVLLTPVFYFVLLWLSERKPAQAKPVPHVAAAAPAARDGAPPVTAIRQTPGE